MGSFRSSSTPLVPGMSDWSTATQNLRHDGDEIFKCISMKKILIFTEISSEFLTDGPIDGKCRLSPLMHICVTKWLMPLNLLKPGNAKAVWTRYRTGLSVARVMVWYLLGTKPLPKSMITNVTCELDTEEQVWIAANDTLLINMLTVFFVEYALEKIIYKGSPILLGFNISIHGGLVTHICVSKLAIIGSANSKITLLTSCCQLMTYGDRDLGQHRVRQWISAWRHQAIVQNRYHWNIPGAKELKLLQHFSGTNEIARWGLIF